MGAALRPFRSGGMKSGRRHLGSLGSGLRGTRCSVVLAAGGSGALVSLVVAYRDLPTTFVVVGAGLLAGIAWISSLLLFRRLVDVRELALRDPLTGLPNRLLLDDRIDQAVVRAQRTGERFALLEIDLDGFKEVNDLRGHEAGDQVLVATAARLQSIVRASDTLARIGGDEFVVLSTGTASEEEAGILVQRIRAELRAPFVVSAGLVEIGGSVGVAIFPADGATPVELLARADSNMFLSKRGPAGSDARPRRGSLDVGIVREFEAALENGELVVHFQPVVDLRAGRVVGAEALVRRVHPERGIVTPAEFLPHIERTSVMREVTLHVVAETYRELARWERLGHPIDGYVNVPLRMIDDPVLVEGLIGLGAAHGIDPSRITLEMAGFTSTAAVDVDRDAVLELRRRRVRLALDDFGRGCSLTALRTMPLDEVKIDGSFVKGAGIGRADNAILSSLIGLSHDLGLIVTAEGVESAGGYGAVRSLGCDRAQGYHVQRPLDADCFAAWLELQFAALAS